MQQLCGERSCCLNIVAVEVVRLRDPDFFARVTVDAEAGTITWPGGLDMAQEPLDDDDGGRIGNILA